MLNYRDILASQRRPKIGVVLSGGGLRAFAAFELFEFFEQAHIPIDLLIGCSGGSLAAVSKGLGLTVKEMRSKVVNLLAKEDFNIDYGMLLKFIVSPIDSFNPQKGLFKKEPLIEAMGKLTNGCNFDALAIPTILQATNVQTGRGQMLKEGDLVKSLYASCALLPFLGPIQIDEAWYADGLFSNNMPILEAINRGMDIIIAMDFNSISFPMTSFSDYFSVFSYYTVRSMICNQNTIAIDAHHHEIVFIDVPFERSVEFWEVDKLPFVYQCGKQAVEKHQEEIINAIESFPFI